METRGIVVSLKDQFLTSSPGSDEITLSCDREHISAVAAVIAAKCPTASGWKGTAIRIPIHTE